MSLKVRTRYTSVFRSVPYVQYIECRCLLSPKTASDGVLQSDSVRNGNCCSCCNCCNCSSYRWKSWYTLYVRSALLLYFSACRLYRSAVFFSSVVVTATILRNCVCKGRCTNIKLTSTLLTLYWQSNACCDTSPVPVP